MRYHFSLILLPFIIKWTESARILGIYIVCSRSHHSMHRTIIDGLLSRNHEITEISYFTLNQTIPNYTGIAIGETKYNYIDSYTIKEAMDVAGVWNYVKKIGELEMQSCEMIFNLDYIKELIKSKEKRIDLIIAEVYHSHCFSLLAHVLQVPLVIEMPPSLNKGADYFIGNPFNPSVVPLVISPYTTNMNFFQRLHNSIQYAFIYWYEIYLYNRDIQRIAQEYCNMELPSMDVLNQRTALAIYGNHFSLINRSKSPNVIDVAGIHIKPAKKLPKELEEFIEQSPQGVILFSFGSTLKASSIPNDKVKIITDAFSAIPQRVLWRVDRLDFTDVPSNVKLVKWLPQRDLLDHPNVIAFISHCGLFSVLEAIHTATPVIGIPIMFDQFQDAQLLVEKGGGISIDYHTINKDIFVSAIKEIVSPKYRENMQRLSQIFKDRPMPPLDEAIYWIEYVLRYRGALHLRTQAADMPLYKYLLFDVIVVFLAAILSILYLLCRCYKFIIERLYAKKKNKVA